MIPNATHHVSHWLIPLMQHLRTKENIIGFAKRNKSQSCG
jgi:hypothetical protein